MPQVSADVEVPVPPGRLSERLQELELPTRVWVPRLIAHEPVVRWRVDDLGDHARLVALIRYTVTQPRLRLVLTPILQAVLRRRAERLIAEASTELLTHIPTRRTSV